MSLLLFFVLVGLYFFVQWVDENEMYDVVPSKHIIPPEGEDVAELVPGQRCQAVLGTVSYDVRLVASGEML